MESKYPVDMGIDLNIMSITTKFHEILLSGFRGVALTRKTGLMDRLTDGSKTLYPPQLVAWGIIIFVQIKTFHQVHT